MITHSSGHAVRTALSFMVTSGLLLVLAGDASALPTFQFASTSNPIINGNISMSCCPTCGCEYPSYTVNLPQEIAASPAVPEQEIGSTYASGFFALQGTQLSDYSFTCDEYFENSSSPANWPGDSTGGGLMSVAFQQNGLSSHWDTLWGIAANGQVWYGQFTGTSGNLPMTWHSFGSNIITAGWEGASSLAPSIGATPTSDGSPGVPWIIVPGACDSEQDSYIYNWNTSTSSWQRVSGCATYVTVSLAGTPWVVNSAGEIWEYLGSWYYQGELPSSSYPGDKLTYLAVGFGNTRGYGITYLGSVVTVDFSTGSWTTVTTDLDGNPEQYVPFSVIVTGSGGTDDAFVNYSGGAVYWINP